MFVLVLIILYFIINVSLASVSFSLCLNILNIAASFVKLDFWVLIFFYLK